MMGPVSGVTALSPRPRSAQHRDQRVIPCASVGASCSWGLFLIPLGGLPLLVRAGPARRERRGRRLAVVAAAARRARYRADPRAQPGRRARHDRRRARARPDRPAAITLAAGTPFFSNVGDCGSTTGSNNQTLEDNGTFTADAQRPASSSTVARSTSRSPPARDWALPQPSIRGNALQCRAVRYVARCPLGVDRLQPATRDLDRDAPRRRASPTGDPGQRRDRDDQSCLGRT